MVKIMVKRPLQYMSMVIGEKIAPLKMFTKRLCLPIGILALISCHSAAEQVPSEIDYIKADNVLNEIPYFDNRFRIDDNLEEISLLFYRRSGAQPVILVRPDGSKLKINNLPKDRVQWYDDRTFDLIKIKAPMPGPWQVIGEVQPNSKIMIVSEIRLEVTPLPEIILQGETLKMEGRVYNGDMAITDPLFSDVLLLDVDFYSTNNSAYDNFGALPIKLTSFRDDGRALDEHANDSIFTGEFELDFAAGEWEPIYIVKMPMATRELRQTPVVVQNNPIEISVETTQDQNGAHKVTFTIDGTYVDEDSILLQGNITYPDRQVAPFSIMEGKGLTRTYDIDFTEAGVHRLKVNVFGETKTGREFRAVLAEYSFNVDRLGGPLVPKMTAEGKEVPLLPEQQRQLALEQATIVAEQRAQALAQAKAEQEAAVAKQQQDTILYIIIGNALVIMIAATVFLISRRRKRK